MQLPRYLYNNNVNNKNNSNSDNHMDVLDVAAFSVRRWIGGLTQIL